MRRVKRIKKTVSVTALALFVVLSVPSVAVFAHGDEDHGEASAPAVSTSASMVVRTARVGDMEVTVKHLPIEPDKGTMARVFVTSFDSNEPVAKATITLLFGGNAAVEAVAEASSTAGMYEAKLPPLPQGEYTLVARVESEGTTQTVEYGSVKVAPAPSAAVENRSSWARTALIALGTLIVLCIAGILLYRAAQLARRSQEKRRTERQTATA